MMAIDLGAMLPELALTDMNNGPLNLTSFVGKPFILYFYPKDDTPGCTIEAKDFSALSDDFAKAGASVLGVSKDTSTKHQKFTEKYGLSIPLATDESNDVMAALGVWVEKSMYGKSYMGIERSTFLFDASGRLVQVWRKVKVAGHAAEVLNAVHALA